MEIDWRDKIILVADDVETNFLLVEIGLSKTGVNLLWAKNGQEAVDICLQRNDINLVLMDLRMPKKNGYAATQEIRAHFPHLPIIAQTSYAMTEDRQKSLDAGCNDYIAKPFNVKSLTEMISRYIS